MPTIAIIGAAGHIGHAAAQAFLDAGWAVKGVGRGTRLKELPAGVEPVAGDAYDAASLVASTRGADVILHAANPAYDKWETTVLPMVENAIAAAKANGATLLIPGNVYNFGLEIGMDAGEDAAQHPSTDKARIRIAMETRLEAASRDDGVQVIILRAGDFYGGPKGGTWLDMMILKDLKKGKVHLAGTVGPAPRLRLSARSRARLRGAGGAARRTRAVRTLPLCGPHDDGRRHAGGSRAGNGAAAEAGQCQLDHAEACGPVHAGGAGSGEDELSVAHRPFAGRSTAGGCGRPFAINTAGIRSGARHCRARP